MDSRNANNQQDTVRCCLMFSAVSGSLVSNPLAFWSPQPTRLKSPITAFRAPARHTLGTPNSRAFQVIALAPLVGLQRFGLQPREARIWAPLLFLAQSREAGPGVRRNSGGCSTYSDHTLRQFSTLLSRLRQFRHFTTFFDWPGRPIPSGCGADSLTNGDKSVQIPSDAPVNRRGTSACQAAGLEVCRCDLSFRLPCSIIGLCRFKEYLLRRPIWRCTFSGTG
jgi:hypothetical protein